MLDLQKANMWKRISAWLFDIILLFIVIVGFAFMTAWVVDFEGYYNEYAAVHAEYVEAYNIDLDADTSGYTEEQLKEYNDLCDQADAAFAQDERAQQSWGMMVALIPVIIIVSAFLGYLVMEFIIPLFLKEGRTLGKKIFGICLMRADSVRVSNVQLFVRTILGKFTIETLIPVAFLFLIILNVATVVAPVAIIGIFGTQIIMLIASETRSTIHDKMAGTVVVDFASQMMFDSHEEMLAYKQRVHEEAAARSPY